MFLDNIEKLTLNNSNFRMVLFTGQHQQLVIMSLKPKEEIGTEVHVIVDQFFRVESGQGKLLVNGEAHKIAEGDAFIVPAGTQHNVINTSTTEPLKIYTVYSPPHHKDKTIHKTKAEAEKDTKDHI